MPHKHAFVQEQFKRTEQSPIEKNIRCVKSANGYGPGGSCCIS